MQIVRIDAYDNGSRPPVQLWNMEEPPEGYAEITQDQADIFYSTNPGGFVTLTTRTNEAGYLCVDTIEVNEEALEEYKANLPDPVPGAKAQCIERIKGECEKAINEGTTVKYDDGSEEHFSYTLADQSNISEMFTAVLSGATEFPYHADGDTCKIYTKEQIVKIYGTLSMHKTEATTYHNSLKAQVKAMTKLEEINSVGFGYTELTGEYLENYNTMMASAKTQLEAVLAKVQ